MPKAVAVEPSGGRSTPRTRAAASAGPVQAVAANDQWYVQTESEEQYGPISRRELDTWVAEGRLTGACQVLQNGWDQWKWAGELYSELADEDEVTSSDDNPFGAIVDEASSVNHYAAPQHSVAASGSAPSVDGQTILWNTVSTGLTIAYNSLLVGTIGFGAVSIGLLYLLLVASGGPSGGGSSAYFIMVMTIWGAVAVFASSVSLLTGWCVCLQVPRRSQATTPIQGAIGAIGVAIVLAFVSTLIPLGMMGNMTLETMQTIQKMSEVVPWMVQMALIAALTCYGFFLGALGRFFNNRELPQLAMFYAFYQGANAVWTTLTAFVIETNSPTMANAPRKKP